MAQPTRSRQDLRLDVLHKIDPVSEPKNSSCTSDADSRTVLNDTALTPLGHDEDYVGSYIYVRSQPDPETLTTMNDSGGIGSSDLTVTVTSGSVFLTGDGLRFGVDAEIMRIASIDGNVLTIVRGIQGTSPMSHADGLDADVIGPAVGEIARVEDVEFGGTTSQLIITQALSASLVDGQEYERHRKVRPSIINDRLDVTLGLIRQNVLLPVTLIIDGDMEDDPATNFTVVSSTLTNDTTKVRHGRQSLKIAATSDLGGAISTAVAVPPNTSLIVAADVYITSGDGVTLAVLGATTSAGSFGTLETATSDIGGWVHLEFLVTQSSTGEWIKILVSGTLTSDIVYLDNLILWPVADQGIELPSFLEFVYDVKSLFYFPVGTGLTGSGNSNAYRINEGTPQFYAHYQRERDDTGVVSARFYVDNRKPTNALWLKGRKPYPAFSGTLDSDKDTDTTQAHKNVVVNMTAASLIDDFALDATEAEKFELARKLQEKAVALRFEVNALQASMTPPKKKIITTPFTRK